MQIQASRRSTAASTNRTRVPSAPPTAIASHSARSHSKGGASDLQIRTKAGAKFRGKRCKATLVIAARKRAPAQKAISPVTKITANWTSTSGLSSRISNACGVSARNLVQSDFAQKILHLFWAARA